MATLYPPYIEGTIPAQVGDTLRIPYQLNRAVGEADLDGAKIRARIKTVSTNVLVAEALTCAFRANAANDIYTAEFDISQYPLSIGQFYKIQLTFEKEGYAGQYYSTVGVFKYTVAPAVAIAGLEADTINNLQGVLKGEISTSSTEKKDPSEKVNFYKFDILTDDNQLLESSGWQIHNATLATNADIYAPEHEFESDTYYKIQYSIRTINELEVSTPKYLMYRNYTFPLNLKITSFVRSNRENGGIEIGFIPEDTMILKGIYLLQRRDSNNKLITLKEILFNTILAKNSQQILFKDFSVEQGQTYTYYLCQKSTLKDGSILLTDKQELGTVNIDFEDMFLWDGERQLRIRFNPKVSSFKTTTLESKLDTIGGKYPFIFRNGNTGYKEFPISGLISCHMDSGDFSDTKMPDNEKYFSTDLVSDNITTERTFKLEVLDWLNNGKVKLFRSPTEGNYLVRLMNISLSPEDRLGRMLHTFNATAYEVAAADYNALLNQGYINFKEERINMLNNKTVSLGIESSEVSINKAIKATVYDAQPGTKVTIAFERGSSTEVIIGLTGVYNIFIDRDNPLIAFSSTGPCKLEYWYEREQDYPIRDANGAAVTGVSYKEQIDQVIGPTDKQITYDKLKYLRIQKKDLVLYAGIEPTVIDTSIACKLGDESTISYTYILNEIKYDLSGAGRIEYTKDDFAEGLSTTLQLEEGLYADVYYGSSTITTEEDDV